MENPLYISTLTPVSSGLASKSMRRSPTSGKLSAMGSSLKAMVSSSSAASTRRAMRLLNKPPRHSNVPMFAQILLKIWQCELQRRDVSITSDFFYDLDGTDEQAVYLVERMQEVGFNINIEQFFAMERCTIYSVLLVAL